MDEWAEVIDKATGRPYYYNKKTRETRWTKPTVASPATVVSSAVSDAANTTTDAESVTEDDAVDEHEELPPDWFETKDKKTGTTYFYNKKTKETSWIRPKGAAASSRMESSVSASNLSVNNVPLEPNPMYSGGGMDNGIAHEFEGKSASEERMTGDTTGGTQTGNTGDVTGAGHLRRRQKTGVVSPDGNWDQVTDTNGQTYWCHRVTKATVWVLPSSAKIPADKANELAHLAMSDKERENENKLAVPKLAAENVERPSESMLKLKEAINTRKLEEPDGNTSDQEENADLGFSETGGVLNRVFKSKKPANEEQILTYKKTMINKPLLKKNSHLSDEACQCFKNILSYMGDRTSTKAPIDHAHKLLYSAMSHPVGIRDEIYLQLCKQTTNNPRITSSVKGWELMMFCLATFPPSKQLKKFLTEYFRANSADSPDTEPQIQTFAKEALNRLEKILLLGQRKEVPCALELDCIRSTKPVPIRVNLVDGTFKTLQVDAYTLTSDVEKMMAQKLNLTMATPFALYEFSAADALVERQLDAKDRVLDVVGAWERNEFSDDVKQKVGKSASNNKLNQPYYNQFLYKARLLLKTNDPDVQADPEAIHMLYIQAIQSVLSARYPIKEKDVCVLAALQLQTTYGDYVSEAHSSGWLIPKLSEVMPEALLLDSKNKRSETIARDWEEKIVEKYSRIRGFTSLEAKLNYLDYVQEWPSYGATFFVVEQRQFKDYPSPLALGITCEGIILMHPQKKVLLESYPYADIVTWGYSEERFIVVVGNSLQQRKLIFKAYLGKVMNGLVQDYVKFKVKYLKASMKWNQE